MPYSKDPSTSAKDYLRFKTGDIVDPEVLFDSEYEFILSENEDDKEKSLIEAVGIMLPRISSYANEKVGNVSIDYNDWYERLKSWYDDITSVSEGSSVIYVGGQYQSEIDTVNSTNTGKALFNQFGTDE